MVPAAPAPTRMVMGMGGQGFMGRPEATLIDRMLNSGIVRIKPGSGGRSLAFKLYFEDGSRGYFKPEQSFSGSHWYAEVAAYYLDRALGLGRVPPVVSRRLAWAPLSEAAGDDRRTREVTRAEDGTVRGALVSWIEDKLKPASTPAGWENWIRVENYPVYGVTPYQRPSQYAAALNDRKGRMAEGRDGVSYYKEVPAADGGDRPAELSDMIVFDFLTLNIDRWGGDNVNVLTLDGGPLIFLDNGAGFSVGPHRRGLMDDRLHECQRFRRSTIDALRTLDMQRLARRLTRDPQGPILNDGMIEGIDVRRKAVLQYVAELEKKYGPAVLPW